MIMDALRNNLGYKLVSLVLAFLLWAYVQNVENPPTSKTLEVTPQLMNVPRNLRPAWNQQTVRVTVRDRKDVIARIHDNDLIAAISLMGAVEGEHAFPVAVKFSERLAMTDKPRIEKKEPGSIVINLEPIDTIARKVTVLAEPPLGSRWLEATIEPAQVMLSGPRSLLKHAKVFLRIDKKNSTLPSGEEYVEKVRVTIEDTQGQPLEDVRCDPTTVEFRGRLEVQFKQFPVHVTYSGAPQSGYRVRGAIEAEPSTVLVAGNEETLSQIDAVSTEPVDISGASRTRESVVKLRVPPGLKLRGTSRIKVTIHIEPESGAGNLPGPAPSRDQ